MLFLRTFGGLSLENGGRPIIGAAAQPRRLAVLAVLAVADDAGLSRDQLCARFCTDSNAEHPLLLFFVGGGVREDGRVQQRCGSVKRPDEKPLGAEAPRG